MKKIQFAVACAVVMSTGILSAGPVVITGYDIDNTYISGTGDWAHTYSGAITPVSGDVANYTGGSGTLNNGVIEVDVDTTQLFNYPLDSSPVITLYLDDYYSLNSLLISGGDFLSNFVPGELAGLDVTIGSSTENFITSPQGINVDFRFADDFVDFTGSSLDGLVTNQLKLSGFNSNLNAHNSFSIAEITLDGTSVESTPEPTSLAIFGIGALCMGAGAARRRRKEQQAAKG